MQKPHPMLVLMYFWSACLARCVYYIIQVTLPFPLSLALWLLVPVEYHLTVACEALLISEVSSVIDLLLTGDVFKFVHSLEREGSDFVCWRHCTPSNLKQLLLDLLHQLNQIHLYFSLIREGEYAGVLLTVL